MKWTAKDLDMYVQAKEYVDTLLIPLVPLSFGERIKKSGSMNEFITILCMEIEKQMKGRILVMPPFHYLFEDSQKLQVLKDWEREAKDNGFKHVFFLTADMKWKQHGMDLGEHLVWIPAIPLENLEIDQAREMVSEQVSQIIDMFSFYWKNG